MKNEQHNKLKESFDNISKILQNQNLSVEERKNFENLHAELAGALLSSWLPIGGGRKFIMLIIALVAIYFLLQSAYLLMIITLIILCMFSPRIIGEIAILIGKAKGNN